MEGCYAYYLEKFKTISDESAELHDISQEEMAMNIYQSLKKQH